MIPNSSQQSTAPPHVKATLEKERDTISIGNGFF